MTALSTTPTSRPTVEAASQVLRDRDRVDRAIDLEGRDGLQLALKGRLLALLAIAVLLIFLTPFPGVLYYNALIAVFAASGLLQGRLEKSAYQRTWDEYAFVAFEAWNAERRARGQEPIRLSIGLHFGPVVVGDIASQRRLELPVLRDTVNVASRLQELTRSLDCRAAISDATPQAVRNGAGVGGNNDLEDLQRRGELPIRGREELVGVWVL